MNQKNNATNTPPKFLPLDELKKILKESYEPPPFWKRSVPRQALSEYADYGDLWNIYRDGTFISERFKKISDSDKEIALKLICQEKYSESDLVRIGVDKNSKGFALTKESFCLKELKNFIIPYGNIKSVELTMFNNLKIIFYKNKNETAKIVWETKAGNTCKQLCKYLNKVKKFYSPNYDKLFIEGGN